MNFVRRWLQVQPSSFFLFSYCGVKILLEKRRATYLPFVNGKWQKAVRERCQRMFLRGILSAMCHVDSERNKRFLFFLPCLTDTAAISGSPLHEHSIPGYLPGSVVCFYLKNKKKFYFFVFKPTPFLRNLTLPHFLKIYYDFLSHRCYVSA